MGMNNPISSDPAHALYPWPKNCTGWRVWRMLCDGLDREVPRSSYLEAFERVNVLPGREWSQREGRYQAGVLARRLVAEDRTFVVFGAQCRAGVDLLAGVEALRWQEGALRPWRATWAPHPSGRCRWYNEAGNRDRVCALLAELFNEGS